MASDACTRCGLVVRMELAEQVEAEAAILHEPHLKLTVCSGCAHSMVQVGTERLRDLTKEEAARVKELGYLPQLWAVMQRIWYDSGEYG